MFYVILTIVILIVFGTILSAPKQPKQIGGYQDIGTVISSLTSLDTIRGEVNNLHNTIASIAPDLPIQGSTITEIFNTLTSFQTTIFGQLDKIFSDIKNNLVPKDSGSSDDTEEQAISPEIKTLLQQLQKQEQQETQGPKEAQPEQGTEAAKIAGLIGTAKEQIGRAKKAIRATLKRLEKAPLNQGQKQYIARQIGVIEKVISNIQQVTEGAELTVKQKEYISRESETIEDLQAIMPQLMSQ